jgi:hypothetical protein
VDNLIVCYASLFPSTDRLFRVNNVTGAAATVHRAALSVYSPGLPQQVSLQVLHGLLALQRMCLLLMLSLGAVGTVAECTPLW